MSGTCTVVTGATSGIGAVVAARLLARGENVVFMVDETEVSLCKDDVLTEATQKAFLPLISHFLASTFSGAAARSMETARTLFMMNSRPASMAAASSSSAS